MQAEPHLPHVTPEAQEPPHLSALENVAEEKPTTNNLSAYMVKPKLQFETQDREEKIILLLRRHIVTNIPWSLSALILFSLPLGIYFIGPRVLPLSILPFRYHVVLVVAWYLMIIAYSFAEFLSWYYNVYIITDERIVDVDFHSLLYKKISETKIDNIQDVTFESGGLLRSMLNFGTVYIQTAGEKREFEFEDIPNPDRVSKVLNELVLEEEQEKLEGRVR